MKTKVLVTGGTGYIGSHTAVELMEQGYDIVIADNLSNSNINVLDGIEEITNKRPEFVQIDLCEEQKVKELFDTQKDISAIIHFAAYKAVGESVENPLKYYQNNLGSLINVLKYADKKKIKAFVFSSSCTVYGQPEKLPVDEQAPILPAASPYGNTKQIAEEIIEDLIKSKTTLNAINLRYFNPIGAHKSALIGELPIGVPDNLLPFITQTAIGLREQLKVFGNDYNTPDGSCIRDYINVVDLAKAHIIAIERILNDKNKSHLEVFNLGTGKGVSVLEMIHTFEKVSGQKLNYEIVGRRAGDIERVWANTSLANNELGWKAEITLDETLKSAWNWELNYRRNLKNG